MDFELPLRSENANKGTFGRVLNIAGSDYMPGAAYLSSVAALTSGCGYVFLATTERVINAVAAQTQNVVFAPLSDIDSLLKTADVLLIGCGLSTDKKAKQIFFDTIKNVKNIPVIIDADGLNILSEANEIQLPEKLILTPHIKEASRLLHTASEKISADMEFYAKKLTEKFSCTTVLKSSETIVCGKDLQIYRNQKQNSALAKAGSGDVLAGIIAGLLAQGLDEFNAAKTGVYIHSLAGEYAKNDLTEFTVMANDQIRFISYAFKKLLN